MKTKLFLFIAFSAIANSSLYAQGGYSGGMKPAVVKETPANTEHFVASSVDKLAKTNAFVVTQFNVNIAEEEYIVLRSGGAKATMDDAMLNLQYKLVNLDKSLMQTTVNELHSYLLEKLKTDGFTVKEYEAFKAHKNFAKLTTNESFNGNYATGIDAGSRPGFSDIASAKFIGFSANSMPSINIQGMKGAKIPAIGTELEANPMGFGLSIHFLEWEGTTSKTGKAEASSKPQIFFGTSNMTIFPYKKIGYVTIIDQKKPYSFDKEFVAEIKEGADMSVINNAKYKTYSITVDNEKLKAVILELGKSYIDNMVKCLAVKE